MNKFYASLKGMVVLGLILCWGVGFGQPGSLDVSFGNGGIKTMAFDSLNTELGSIAQQADGKIIVAGTGSDNSPNSSYVVSRLNINGSLDSSFGIFGKKKIGFPNGTNNIASSVAIQPDGKNHYCGDRGRILLWFYL